MGGTEYECLLRLFKFRQKEQQTQTVYKVDIVEIKICSNAVIMYISKRYLTISSSTFLMEILYFLVIDYDLT